jgi:hypothetical protein
MKNVILQAPGGTPKLERGFKKVEPSCEGIRLEGDSKVLEYLRMCSPKKAEDDFIRFLSAKDALSRDFGGAIGALERSSGGYVLAARLDFLTTHDSMDGSLQDSIAGAGFELHHRSWPVTSGPQEERYETRVRSGAYGIPVSYTLQKMIKMYSITEGERTRDLAKAGDTAEALLRLVAVLRPAGIPEDLPVATSEGGAKIMDLEAARATRASRPPPPAEPGKEEAKVS